jgi:bacteriocin-like protein
MTSSSEELSEHELKAVTGGSAASTFGVPSLGAGQAVSTYRPGGVALGSAAYAAEGMATSPNN